ncbi:MAG TPA: Ppx/GppA phosphatase family protein [Acidimicrobiales bacterium]|nr:Ppx/GppA phosphatase family protein [Acidimicrobiales bacterium]
MADDADGLAALDCGTNSTRLLIVDGRGVPLVREMRITRLGEGVDATQKLSADAMARTVSVLRDYKRLMDDFAVVRARLVATSAARDAVNADEFLTAAEEATAVRPELLSGQEEGQLSFVGATASLPEGDRGSQVLVVDIGGGSTELVIGRTPEGPGPVTSTAVTVKAVSLDIGCVRLSERFFHHDPPLVEELAEARGVVEAEVGRARQELPPAEADATLIGLAGTVSTLAALNLQLDHYERARIHHARLTRDQVEVWLHTLATEDRRARLRRPGMVEGRADVIVGGVLMLASVMAGFDKTACLVSEDDILDGIVASLRAPHNGADSGLQQ